MSGASTFFAGVWHEFARSLGEAVGLFGRGGVAQAGALQVLVTRLLVSLLLLALFAILHGLARRALRVVGARMRVPRDVLALLRRALLYAALLLGALAVLSQFGMDRTVLLRVAVAAFFALLFYGGWLIAARVLANAAHRAGIDRSLEQLLRNVLAVVLGALAVITVMDQFSVDVLGVITALGVVGIAVGFAAQDTLSNFIAGITLLIERPFRIGDWVEISGKVGRVERITLRTTRVITRDNVHSSIPNSMVASSEIANLSAGGPLRLAIPVGIAYKESAARAREALLPVLSAHRLVLQDPLHAPRVLVEELADSSVNLVLHAWIAPETIAAQPTVSAELLEGAKDALDAAGIEIPFPHLQLFLENSEGLAPFARRWGAG